MIYKPNCTSYTLYKPIYENLTWLDLLPFMYFNLSVCAVVFK